MEQASQSHGLEDKELDSTDEELNPNRALLAEIGRWARRGREERFTMQVRNMVNNVDRAKRKREANEQN